MKITRKIVAIILTMIIVLSLCVLAFVSVGAATDWKTVYKSYIKNNTSNSDKAIYYLTDLDDNGIPELFYDTGNLMDGEYLNVFYNNKVNTFKVGSGGFVKINNNRIYGTDAFLGTVFEKVFEIKKGKAKQLFDGIMKLNTQIKPYGYEYRYSLNDSNNYSTVTSERYQSTLKSYFNPDEGEFLSDYANESYNQSEIMTAIDYYDVPISGPNITLSNKSNGIRVEWSPNYESFGTNIYYKKEGDTDWTSLNNQTRDVNYHMFFNVSSGVKYYFIGRYIFPKGYRNNYSDVKSLTYIAQPTISSLNYNGGNTLTWNKITGANNYQIARKKTGDSDYTYYTTTNTSYTEKNVTAGVTYTYQVRAMYQTANDGTAYGAWSPSKSVVTIAKPTLKLSNKSNGIRAEWNAVGGAQKYTVYYRKASVSSWSSATTTNNYYPLLNITPGEKYCVQIRPIGKVNGPYSAVQSLTYIPQVKPVVTVSNKSNGIRAEWKAIGGATKYIVYYKKTADSSWSSIQTANTYYPLLNISAGTGYSVQVQPVFGSAKGLYSAVAKLTYIPAVKPVVTLSNKSNGIRTEWKSIGGATKYIVYYKKTADSKWSSVETKNTYYPLLNLTKGTSYSVQVQPVFGSAKGLYSAVNKLTYSPVK